MTKQRDAFLEGEGDAWFERNRNVSNPTVDTFDHLIASTIADLGRRLPDGTNRPRVLEIGCSSGRVLERIALSTGYQVVGIDPSAAAVTEARSRGVEAFRGTADELPFESGSFDVVLFGFCLYLCDLDSLFAIASEGTRVLRDHGLIVIFDFFSPKPRSNPYVHLDGIVSMKMDFRKLFTWHPNYRCISHVELSHSGASPTSDPDDTVAISVIAHEPSFA